MLVALMLMSVETENRDSRAETQLGVRFLNNLLPTLAPGEQMQPCLVDLMES